MKHRKLCFLRTIFCRNLSVNFFCHAKGETCGAEKGATLGATHPGSNPPWEQPWKQSWGLSSNRGFSSKRSVSSERSSGPGQWSGEQTSAQSLGRFPKTEIKLRRQGACPVKQASLVKGSCHGLQAMATHSRGNSSTNT